jgi:hypothetical protein
MGFSLLPAALLQRQTFPELLLPGFIAIRIWHLVLQCQGFVEGDFDDAWGYLCVESPPGRPGRDRDVTRRRRDFEKKQAPPQKLHRWCF